MSKLNAWKIIFLLCVCCAVTAIGSPAQTFTTLFNFDGKPGANPNVGVVQATDGNLYGTTVNTGTDCYFCGGTVFKITPGGTLTTLFNFQPNGEADGTTPFAGLVQATNGNFYGTTYSAGDGGGGTVFEITPSGTLTTLHSFCLQSGCRDGGGPSGG